MYRICFITLFLGIVLLCAGCGRSKTCTGSKDAPIYPGATVTMNTTTPDGMMIVLKTKDSLIQVKEFYGSKLKEQGWESKSSYNTPRNTILAYRKDDRTLAVTINSGDETTIQLITTKD